MIEYLENALEELKRADHLIYVSLKYTRTVDVIRSVIERLINVYTVAFEGLLEKAKEEKKIAEIPLAPKLRCEQLKQLYPDSMLVEYIRFYMLLRKLLRLDYSSEREFRRHVAMIATLDGDQIEVNIDIVTEYYKRTKEFLRYFRDLLLEEND